MERAQQDRVESKERAVAAAGAQAMPAATEDAALVEAVRRELASDAVTCRLSLEISVTDGFVRFSGSVPTLEDAEAAEEVAYRVPGVTAAVADVTASR